MTNGELITQLVKTNEPLYNLSKAGEELNELATELAKKLNKAGGLKEPKDQEIIDEIGDVQIRLQVLKEMFGEPAVNDRIQKKIDKYKKYIENGEYIGRI